MLDFVSYGGMWLFFPFGVSFELSVSFIQHVCQCWLIFFSFSQSVVWSYARRALTSWSTCPTGIQTGGGGKKLTQDETYYGRKFTEVLRQLRGFFSIVTGVDPVSNPIMCRVDARRTALNVVVLLYLFGVFGKWGLRSGVVSQWIFQQRQAVKYVDLCS